MVNIYANICLVFQLMVTIALDLLYRTWKYKKYKKKQIPKNIKDILQFKIWIKQDKQLRL